MPQKLIDQTTIQPDGRPGDDAFTAFATCNENFADAEGRLTALESGSSNIGQDLADLKDGLQQEAQLRADADAALAARIPGKNIVINGDFRFWQRGTGFNAAGYGADRFLNNINGITCSMTRLALGVGEIAGFKYACRMSFNGGSDPAHYATLQHRMESLGYYSGKTLTFSGYMRANTAGLKVAFEVALGAGGGTIPGAVPISGIGVQTFTLGTTWQRFTATFTVPDLAGASLTDNSSLNFNLWLSAGSSHNFRNNNLGFQSGIVDFVGLQLEDGGTATIFERRPDALELALCQRYYEKSYNLSVAPGTPNSDFGQEIIFLYGVPSQQYATGKNVVFKARKRTTPAITSYSTITGAAGKARSFAPAADVDAVLNDLGETSAFITMVITSTNNINLRWQWAADAEL
ncbi:hypothetical protein ROV94_15905 [Stenotrophomonas maltophilia]|uniref:Ig-like domain-containing protein n=1 Tax=Stenotrophomonas maltophilia TaxID=40324 RepID=UPI002895D842|nr:hypothetical protein [Stenotrophomonas maltophilia]MDT3432353.1 hypothetical protein [Stenotrophomonas maltophilia]